jgi:hypothetical protein
MMMVSYGTVRSAYLPDYSRDYPPPLLKHILSGSPLAYRVQPQHCMRAMLKRLPRFSWRISAHSLRAISLGISFIMSLSAAVISPAGARHG